MAEELEGRVQEIERSVETLESQMRAHIARTESGTRAVLVIGIILIAIIFGYLTWLSSEIKKAAEPTGLATIFEGWVRDRVPALMSQLETTLTSQAPDIVGSLRAELIKAIPKLRERSEEAALAALDKFAEGLDAKVDDIVQQVLDMKQKELQPLIEAAAEEGGAERLEQAFEQSLEELIGPKFDEALRDYYAWMDAVEMHLERLQSIPEDRLTPEEQLEKEIITAILIFIDEAVKTAPQVSVPF